MSVEFQLIDLVIPPDWAGERLDRALAGLLPEHSRTRIRGWIDAGDVEIGRRRGKPSDAVDAGDRVRIRHGAPPAVDHTVQAEAIALQIVHQDRDCLVIDKP
ncbi:MAG: RNA pseudouridine synthase, partial [Gammaproteobacteria bacterium]|nr:RNA pseudouridine synthase [Gammaproteobacteria bacterium]